MALLLLLLPCHKSTSISTFPPVAHNRQPNHYRFLFIPPSPPRPLLLFFQSNHQTHTSPFAAAAAAAAAAGSGGGRGRNSGGGGGRNNGRGDGWWGREDWWWDGGGDDGNNDGNNDDNNNSSNSNSNKVAVVSVLSLLCCFRLSSLALAGTAPPGPEEQSDLSAWEVKGGKWTKLVPGDDNDHAFLTDGRMLGSPFVLPFSRCGLRKWLRHCQDAFVSLMLPGGYPNSVTSDYLEYSLWRAVQGIASQISGVLSTQALLYAVGLGKGAIPTAAAISWVLKDGIGYLSKIMLSKYGRHFDVHPKGWRLFADLLENAAFGLEILTPAFRHLFVLIGAAAGAGRSAATLIQAATRSCFFAGFAAQRNFAEVIAKGEAQGMVSKFIGIVLGIALANYIGTSTPLALAAFGIVTGIHMYCNLKSYQSIQLRTLNPYRASLVFSEYLLSGEVPSVKEVNNEEPLFPVLPLVDVIFSSSASELAGSETLSPASKYAASQICQRLQLGCRLSEIVGFKADTLALFDLFKDEGYMLAEKQGKFCVILKEGSSPDDMLKAVFHVNYLYWLEANVAWLKPRSIYDECRPGGRLHISLDYVRREFSHVKGDGRQAGWITGGLIARPSPYRIRPGYD